MSKAHPEELITMTNLWAFIVYWQSTIAMVAVDYFTMWVGAEALASITPMKIKEFIYKNIIY